MRTVRLQQADGAALVTESDEVLAEDAQAAWQIAEFAGEDDRLPEASQIFAAWRAWPDARELLVFLR